MGVEVRVWTCVVVQKIFMERCRGYILEECCYLEIKRNVESLGVQRTDVRLGVLKPTSLLNPSPFFLALQPKVGEKDG